MYDREVYAHIARLIVVCRVHALSIIINSRQDIYYVPEGCKSVTQLAARKEGLAPKIVLYPSDAVRVDIQFGTTVPDVTGVA